MCVFVLDNGIFWILQDSRLWGIPLCYMELPKDNSTLNVHIMLQMVNHNSKHIYRETYVTRLLVISQFSLQGRPN